MGKGENFERLMPRELSDWFTCGERDDLYWRKRTRHHKESKNFQLGDVVCESSEGQELTDLFSIELKAGYSKSRSKKPLLGKDGIVKKTKTGKPRKTVVNKPWDVLDLIDYTKRKNQKAKHFVLLGFWEQTTRDAEIAGKIPLLIFKRDFHVPVVVMDTKHLILFEEYLGTVVTDCEVKVLVDGSLLRLIRKEDFFEWLTPEIVCLLAKKLKNKKLKI